MTYHPVPAAKAALKTMEISLYISAESLSDAMDRAVRFLSREAGNGYDVLGAARAVPTLPVLLSDRAKVGGVGSFAQQLESLRDMATTGLQKQDESILNQRSISKALEDAAILIGQRLAPALVQVYNVCSHSYHVPSDHELELERWYVITATVQA